MKNLLLCDSPPPLAAGSCGNFWGSANSPPEYVVLSLVSVGPVASKPRTADLFENGHNENHAIESGGTQVSQDGYSMLLEDLNEVGSVTAFPGCSNIAVAKGGSARSAHHRVLHASLSCLTRPLNKLGKF